MMPADIEIVLGRLNAIPERFRGSIELHIVDGRLGAMKVQEHFSCAELHEGRIAGQDARLLSCGGNNHARSK